MKALILLMVLVNAVMAFTESPPGTFTTDGTDADIQAAFTAATDDGDIVVLPPGTISVDQQLTWTSTNGILLGGGTSATGGGDVTTFDDDYNSANPTMMLSGIARITGITFAVTGSGTVKENGTIVINSAGAAGLRIDHCHWISQGNNKKPLYLGGGVFGVMDHCFIEFNGLNGFYLYNGRSSGDGPSGEPDLQGNLEWTLPTGFGTADYFFFEDNIFNGTQGSRVFDAYTGGRGITRFNTMLDVACGETHATGHAPDDRGSRSQEHYGNLITSELVEPGFCAIDIKNGTYLIWGNSWDSSFKNVYHIRVTRSDNSTYGQFATPTGWGYAGTNFNGTGSNWDGNTDATTGYPVLDQPGRGAGQLLERYLPNKRNAVTGTIAWPNQALEPVYTWNNIGAHRTGWGGAVIANHSGGRVQSDRDIYLPASGIQTSKGVPFDGTTGTGWGTLANRPDAPVTPGVGYWVTNEGDWNTSTSNPYGVQQNGADGVLYKANGSGDWVLYYEPYIYPHPLNVSEGEPPPSSPVRKIGRPIRSPVRSLRF